MTTQQTESAPRIDKQRLQSRCNGIGDLHFLAAAAVLVASAVGWRVAVSALGIVLQKAPVPWPPGVRVDTDFRLLSLARQFGPYERVEADGECPDPRTGQPVRDHRPDGEILYEPHLMDLLGIGTGYDRTRYDERCSNWYVSRIYRDGRERPGSPYRYWQLDVTYYTGSLDTVPHVPERCLVAGGATVSSSAKVTFRADGVSADWSGDLVFRRTRYEKLTERTGSLWESVQYYTFSLNGRPESAWEKVRGTLTLPGIPHAYFAKIQFAPRDSVTDLAETDRRAQDFLSQALPEILRALPTRADVQKLADRD